MFVADMDTTHFAWLSIGNTEDEAREAIARCFAAHIAGRVGTQQSGSPFDALEASYYGMGLDPPEDLSDMSYLANALDDYYGIAVTKLNPGEASRDHMRFVPGTGFVLDDD